MFNYDGLIKLMNRKGESLHSLMKRGLITDFAMRQISAGKSISLDHVANLCRFFGVTIEQVVKIELPDE